MRIEDVFDRYRLWRDPRYVGGLITGIGFGAGIAYNLGWEQTLALKPIVITISSLLLMIVGQETAVRALRRCRETGDNRPQYD
jgi:hypothetical protein